MQTPAAAHAQTQTAGLADRYSVKYFDAKASRAGKGGVRVASFADRDEAEAFAAANILYSRPCKVETRLVAFRVRYTNPGTKIGESLCRDFATREEADAFAATARMFSKPACVEAA